MNDITKKIFLSITHERNIHIVIFSSLVVIGFIILTINYLFPNDDFSLSSIIKETEQKNLRILETVYNSTNNDSNTDEYNYIQNNITENITNNTEDNGDFLYIKIKKVNLNITEKMLLYEFVKTITTGFYYGNWDQFEIKKNKLNYPRGEGYLNFYRKADRNYLLNLGKDCNFTFTLEDIKIVDLQNETINIILYDVPISYSWEEYIDEGKLVNLNHTFINLTFYKHSRQFQDYMDYKLTRNDFGNITLDIRNSTDMKYIKFAKKTKINTNNSFLNESMDINDNYFDSDFSINNTINNIDNNESLEYEHNFQVSFKGMAYGSRYYSKKSLDYSILMSICCIIEIYLTSEFTKLVNTNDQMAINTDLYTILFHIMWTSLICGANFFMSLTRTSSSYEFGMPSFCYFSLFSIFLLRVLFLAWKARNRDITNMRLFRKKLLKFYLFFYVFLFISLISVKIWYSYFICTLLLIGSTWISQIIYSAKKGTKPPMSYSYIFSASLSKIIICIYLKAYKNNIFGYRPNYFKAIIVCLVIIIEALILAFQKFFGAKAIIPRRFRKQGYNYYRRENEITEEEKEVECVICLDKLRNLVNLDDDEDIRNIQGNMIYKFFMKNLEKLKKKQEDRGDYMITPCHHLFHKACLEHWLNLKNQCPYCRQQIPPLEDF